MKNSFDRRSWAIWICAIGIIFAFAISYGYSLSNLTDIAQIIAAFSIFIALFEFWYQRRRDMALAAADQINFFRKEIFDFNDKLRDAEKKADSSYNFPEIQLSTQHLSDFGKDPLGRKQYQIMKHDEVSKIQGELLNALEELSVRIIHFNSINHPAMDALRSPFVHIVEQNIVRIFLGSNLIGDQSTYSYIIRVYNLWKDVVDRRTTDEKWEAMNA